jgi:hypothetical protein
VTTCERCGAPARPFWPPPTTQPTFEKRATRNWLTLSECPACVQLWVGVPYEPYASLLYQVPWNDSAENWLQLAEQNEGKAIVGLVEARVKATWRQLGPEDLAAVEHHRQRSYGRNPVDGLL